MPLFVERKTPPPCVPAKILEPEIKSERIVVVVKPVLTDVHVVPLFVERYTPTQVPAKILEPLDAEQNTLPPVGPVVWVHWAFSELKYSITSRIEIGMKRIVFIFVVF